jgi:hypothetical protein
MHELLEELNSLLPVTKGFDDKGVFGSSLKNS